MKMKKSTLAVLLTVGLPVLAILAVMVLVRRGLRKMKTSAKTAIARAIPYLARESAIVEAIIGDDKAADLDALKKFAVSSPDSLRRPLARRLTRLERAQMGEFAQDVAAATPLMLATVCGNEEAACFLIPLSEVDAQDTKGATAVGLLASQVLITKQGVASAPASGNILRMLADAGADLNHCDRDGRSPLARAIDWGNSGMAAALLRQPACDANKKNANGDTALFEAVSRGAFDCMHAIWPYSNPESQAEAAKAGLAWLDGAKKSGGSIILNWDAIDWLESHWPEEKSAEAFDLSGRDNAKMPRRAVRLEAVALRAEIKRVELAASSQSR